MSEKLDALITVVGTCRKATVRGGVVSDHYFLELELRGEKPHPRALAGFEGEAIAILQIHDTPVPLEDPDAPDQKT